MKFDEKAIFELEKIYNDEITSEDFVKNTLFYNEYVDRENKFGIDFTHFEHFLADEDVRKRNAEYNQMQKKELLKLINLLKEKGFLEKIKEIESITFLSESN